MFEKEKIQLGVNKSMVLNEFDRFWMVTSGEVDIYYTRVAYDGSYKTNLQHFYRAKQGELIFNLITTEQSEDMRFILSSPKASLLAINKNKLFDINKIFLQQLIDKWILKTSFALLNHNAPRVYETLDHNSSVLIEKSKIAYPSKGLKWCIVEEGEVLKFNGSLAEDQSEKKYPFVVSSNLWIKTTDKKANVMVMDTIKVLEDEIFFMLSLQELQNFFYSKLLYKDETQRNNLHERIKQKVKLEDERLTSSLQKLKSIVSGDPKKHIDVSFTEKSSDNPLFKACQFIGNEIGFDFKPPSFTDDFNTNTTNQLFSIAQASNVRARKIILRGTWWKEENGHLLGFLKDEKTPVALIQKSNQKYILKNPTTGEEIPVTSEIANQLDPISYMFFYGFTGSMNSIKKILGFALKGLKNDGRFLLLAALSGSILGLLVPVLSGVLFDDVIPTADRSMLVEVFIIMVMVGVVTAGLQLIRGVLQLRVETKSSINLQAGVMDHLLRLPVTFYKKYTSGDLTNRALSINSIRQILSNTVLMTILSGAFSVVNLGLLFYYESSLAWIGVGLALLAVVVITGLGWLKLKYDREISDHQGEIQGFLFEFLSGITKIRITGAERRVFTLWADRFSKLKYLGFKSGSYQNFVETFNGSYPLVTNIFFFSFIYYTVINATTATTMLSVGAFMAFISAFNQFLNDCLKMSMALISSLNMVSLYERVKPILNEETESTEGTTDPGELSGEIEMNSVSFRYHSEQPLILNDISFHIKPGEMVAFVGTSGSGKSTVMRLLLGFEEPEVGSIYYDGQAFDAMNKDLVRRQIGVVLQNGALMSGSIYKNIVGNSELTLEDAWEAARMAGMEDDIKQMPMEMHTFISEGAGTFSGGQRQRLMIARAIAHKPRLLFMDEATSALDNRTQNIVSESLDKLQATRIVIAHRLSTVVNADKIFVMDKGTIVEAGNYDELMDQRGVFYNLAKRQIANA
ncbi:NHLP bacteriocin export ABC transporter permease/ATPase subunit [Aquimarina brevivitae]|uniref:NHLM bacteriocin system ABC transporter ATP-binding protein n=1 Tax=Aquimarina brevivitae TaxID=323412 RepID=A0A4Q7PGF1_9FLAO|nr:NHLP bacteriocin export ABC transporter permease/ATPase subunit [Aquimarina brevivitae]RZS99445.1 NHLM bacteriocin system ABC transporter ATP-binding protein [Aquimarina brevivitae]